MSKPTDSWASGTPLAWRVAIALAVAIFAVSAYGLREQIGPRGQAGIGVVCFLGIAAMCSTHLTRIRPRTLITGLALQIGLAVLILKVPRVYDGFRAVGAAIAKFLDFSGAGAQFVFGPLANRDVLQQHLGPANSFVFAFMALPTVIFVSSFFTVLYQLGILQWIVQLFSRLMSRVMGTSGAETLSATANVFMGQTEAPLIVKPYVPEMTRSELLALMIGGLATISGGVMAVYIQMGADPTAILATSVMAAPAGLYLAKILVPETEVPKTFGLVRAVVEKPHANIIDAAAAGASDGMQLAINIVAMLIAFIASITLVNHLIGLLDPEWSLQRVFGLVFSPIAFLMGVQGDDIPRVGQLLGTKLVLNEFVAYVELTQGAAGQAALASSMDPRSTKIAIFALTGFANFASIGIQLGGIGAMAKQRRSELAQLGGKALLGGFLATLINASIAGMLFDV